MLGYALIPLVIPHLLLHRIIPSTAGPPINDLSPSEMGYEFVGYACATRPWMTAGYVLLTGVALWHGIVGGFKVLRWAKTLAGKGGTKVEEVKREGEGLLEDGLAVNTSHKGHKGKEDRRGRNNADKGRKVDKNAPMRSLVTTLTSAVCVGLVRMTADAQGMSSFVASRYDAVFASAPWAPLGLR